MKVFIRTAEVLIIIALIILSVISLSKINQVKLIETEDYEKYNYHLAIITDDTASYAYDKFISGVAVTSEENDATYEVYRVGDLTFDEIIDMTILTEVNGVIFRLSDSGYAADGIAKLKEKDIMVVVAGSDVPDSSRDVYIGTNKFNLGRHAAGLGIEAIDGNGKVGVILGSEYVDAGAIATNNFVNGVQDIISKNDTVELSTIKYSSETRAELLMDELLDEASSVDVLICTDPVDVNRILRVLVDRNKVGDVKIIASGDTAEIVDGISKKLIASSIVEDHEEIGSLATLHLIKVLGGERVSSYINVPFETIGK